MLPHEIYNKFQGEVILSRFREILKNLCQKANVKVREEVYEQKGWQCEGEPARAIVFSSDGIPFFAIDITRDDDLFMYSLPAGSADRSLEKAHFPVTDRNFALRRCLQFNRVKYDKQYGRSFFYQWINGALQALKNEYFRWLKLAQTIADEYQAEEPILERDLLWVRFPAVFVEAFCLKSDYFLVVMKDYNEPGLYSLVLFLTGEYNEWWQKLRPGKK